MVAPGWRGGAEEEEEEETAEETAAGCFFFTGFSLTLGAGKGIGLLGRRGGGNLPGANPDTWSSRAGGKSRVPCAKVSAAASLSPHVRRPGMNAAALRTPETRAGTPSALLKPHLTEGWPLSPEESDPEGQGGT